MQRHSYPQPTRTLINKMHHQHQHIIASFHYTSTTLLYLASFMLRDNKVRISSRIYLMSCELKAKTIDQCEICNCKNVFYIITSFVL